MRTVQYTALKVPRIFSQTLLRESTALLFAVRPSFYRRITPRYLPYTRSKFRSKDLANDVVDFIICRRTAEIVVPRRETNSDIIDNITHAKLSLKIPGRNGSRYNIRLGNNNMLRDRTRRAHGAQSLRFEKGRGSRA